MLKQNVTPLYPPLQVRAGVLVVDGHGIALRVVSRGKLRIEDGIGRQRRELVLDRAGSGLERLVIGHAGFVTLDALAWLRAIGAALVQIGREGEVLAHSAPFGYDGHPIRRAQALAGTNGLDLAIARDLIAGKLDGQRRILVRLRADLREFDKLRASLDAADSIERVRVVEANAAALYFAAWHGVRIRYRERDLARIPARWLRCDSRASVLTGAPRAATSPLNAMRNYTLACVESEARLALLAHGLDPTLGVLHADQRNRDSLALDAMEPVRAEVDAFLLDLLEDREFTARDFRRVAERHLPNRSAADA
jgi:CRISPR-associated protein Cas1